MLSGSEQQVLQAMERQLSAVAGSCRHVAGPASSAPHRRVPPVLYGLALVWELVAVLLSHASAAAVVAFLLASTALGLVTILLRQPMNPHLQAALSATAGWVQIDDQPDPSGDPSGD
jgi:hypothetical protein